MTSREKVETYLRAMADEAPPGDMVAASAVTMLPMVMARLPEDPEVLDELLVRYASVLVALRGDGAPPVHLAEGPAPELEEEAAA